MSSCSSFEPTLKAKAKCMRGSVCFSYKNTLRPFSSSKDLLGGSSDSCPGKRGGYQIEIANNGKEAVEKYKESQTDSGRQNDTGYTSSDKEKQDRHYNLIFMDMQMPEMDGLAATQEIRKWEAENGCRVPVIAMTANASEADREKCLEAGMDDYLTKPIKKDEVFALIEKWKWVGS